MCGECDVSGCVGTQSCLCVSVCVESVTCLGMHVHGAPPALLALIYHCH